MASSLAMVHFSRIAEDLILYSSTEFGFIKLADAYSTGSSLMPQKKNPDALELLRGKSGRVIGATFGLVTTVKGTPSTYNKDLQEDKEPLFDVADTLRACSQICNGVISTLKPVPEKMLAALDLPMLATDLSDHLVRKGVPFREAHHVAGAVVKLAEDRGCTLDKLTGDDLRECHPKFGDEAASSGPGGMWDYEAAVERRQTDGGTSRTAVLKQIAELRAWLANEPACLLSS
ncbi:argininosuccinate lyase [Baffinella frigidus]|nr:argininosuccinate lyase [Cryptophyta sp. CCMP2293]